MTTPDELKADLAVIEASLRTHHGDALIYPRLAPLRRAVNVFGFHLATVDLRQTSERHEETLAEMLRAARVTTGYAQLGEPEKQKLLLNLLRDPRPLRIPGISYSDRTESELAVFERGAEPARIVRARQHPPLHHQPHRSGQRSARSARSCRKNAG